ncbi:MAG: hypothetical protein MI810_22985, partial [Flavobacteriales bacterium]|nr:hypothetical protein [Flavobacteriales bacterium]
IMLFLIMSMLFSACGLNENKTQENEGDEVLDDDPDHYVNTMIDSSQQLYSNPEYESGSGMLTVMHEYKTIYCSEGEIIERDKYYGRFHFLTANADGKEYEPELSYEHMVVNYNYTLDELIVTLYSSNDPNDVEAAYQDCFVSVERLDSILNLWGIDRK